MKVTKTGGAKEASSTRKASKPSADDGAFVEALRGTSGAETTEAAQATGGAGPVSGFFGVELTQDATDHRSRGLMMEYGNDLIDQLDRIRMGIMAGAISKDRLQDIARRLRERKITSDDPRLNDLVQDVELRVEVEIAKLTR